MRLNSVSVNYWLRKLLRVPFGLTGSILDSAHSFKVLHPAHTAPSKPALFLEEHLQKIISICSHRTHELEEAKIRGDEWIHAPTIQYKISNIKIRRGHLYKGPYKMSLVVSKDRLLVDEKATDVIPIRAATMASTRPATTSCSSGAWRIAAAAWAWPRWCSTGAASSPSWPVERAAVLSLRAAAPTLTAP